MKLKLETIEAQDIQPYEPETFRLVSWTNLIDAVQFDLELLEEKLNQMNEEGK